MPNLSHLTVRSGRVATVTHAVSLVGPRAAGHAPGGRRRPVEELADRLRAIRPELPFLYSIDLLRPEILASDHWFRPAGVLEAMVARTGELLQDSPAGSAVAATRIVRSLAGAVLGRPAVGLLLARRVPQVGPGSLLLRLDGGGLVAQAAVTDPAVTMLPHDPMSWHADARVLPGEAELTDRLAGQVVATLHPLIEDLHARSGFGVAPLCTRAAGSAPGPSTARVDALVERGAPIRG